MDISGNPLNKPKHGVSVLEGIPPGLSIEDLQNIKPMQISKEAEAELDHMAAPFTPTPAKVAEEPASALKVEPAPVEEPSHEEEDAGDPIEYAGNQEPEVDSETSTPYQPPQQNALQSHPTSLPVGKGAPETISLPPASAKAIQEQVNKTPNLNLTSSQNQSRWGQLLVGSMDVLPMEDPFTPRLEKEDSQFKQEIEHNGKALRGIAPPYKKRPGETVVEGERALLQLITHLGAGGLFRTPLWASGFWVTFKPATDSELLELNRIITADKITAGRWSYGLALSSNTIFTTDRVLEIAIAHVYNTSLKQDEVPINKLRDYIAPQDISSFIWGFLCACYPSGFNYETACINNPAKCNHIFKETLNVTKLQWTDESMLTPWQKQHMSSLTPNSMTLDSIKRYREEMACMQPKRVILNKGTSYELAFTIKTPTISEYVLQGHKWISGMVDNINAVLGMDATDAQRNSAVSDLNKATTLCQYSHWVSKIEYGDLTNEDEAERSISLVTDTDTIENTLKNLSSIDSIREGIIDEILKYIADSTISVIGIPAYECPVCHADQNLEKNYPRHVNIIPLDMLQVFFAVLLQRLDRIATRSDR